MAQTTTSELGGLKMLIGAVAALLGMLLIMQAAFMSWRLALLGVLVLPVALVGGVAAALVNGAELSLGAAIGLLAIFALAARHTVVLVRHFQDLQRHEGERFGAALIRRGGREQLTPILATASASAVAALVFIVLGSRPGLEILSPMAVVVLGGLVTTVLLTLFVLPALYLRFGGNQPELAPEEVGLEEWVAGRPASSGRTREPAAPVETGVGGERAEAVEPAGRPDRKKDGGEPGASGLPSPA
jgi:Cu/Ag efflux pump CusA